MTDHCFRMPFRYLAVMLVFCVTNATGFAQQRVGEVEAVVIDSPHPYPHAAGQRSVVWSHKIHHPEAAFLKLHFAILDVAGRVEQGIPEGDFVVVKDEQGRVRETLSGRGQGDIWTRSVPGSTAFVELHADPLDNAFGVRIDRYGYGAEFSALMPLPRSVCGTDDRTGICEASSLGRIRQADGVAKLVFVNDCGGIYACTGFLFSADGKFMTNAHCANSATESASMEVLFNYADDTAPTGACSLFDRPNPDSYRARELLRADCVLDFAVHAIDDPEKGNPADIYGYLDLSDRIPEAGEAVWLPQHPGGRTKEIAEVGAAVTVAEQEGIDFCADPPTGCGNRGEYTGIQTDFGYVADTSSGSSGSPVMDENNQVIGLHHAGGCGFGEEGNAGVSMAKILTALEMPPATPLEIDRLVLIVRSGRVILRARSTVSGSDAIDPATDSMSLRLIGEGGETVTVTVPAGASVANKAGNRWLFTDPSGERALGVTKFALSRDGEEIGVVLQAKGLELGALDGAELNVEFVIGDRIPRTAAVPCRRKPNKLICRSP